jgi:hypothetical protein
MPIQEVSLQEYGMKWRVQGDAPVSSNAEQHKTHNNNNKLCIIGIENGVDNRSSAGV